MSGSTTLTIRGIDPDVKARLRVRAAQHGRSMEEEVRQILATAVLPDVRRGLGTRIHARFADLGIELDPLERDESPRAADIEAPPAADIDEIDE